jgi:TonB family protein
MRHEHFRLKARLGKRPVLLAACALSLFCLSDGAQAQSGRRPVKKEPPPPAASPEAEAGPAREKEQAEEDKVYMPRQVDVKAKIKNRDENVPSYHRGCPRRMRAVVRVVLHWSGKVTEATLVTKAGCAFDRDALDAARRLKFVPAVKDGRPVSQYVDVEYTGATY